MEKKREDLDAGGYKSIWMNAHCQRPEIVCFNLKVDTETGLSSEEVKLRQKIIGKNIDVPKSQRSFLKMIMEQFMKVRMISLLLAVSLLLIILKGNTQELSNLIEPLLILGILFMIALIDAYQERNTRIDIEKVTKIQLEKATLLRNGVLIKVQISEIVPGDICLLEEEDFVPADIRLISASSLEVRQFSLQGIHEGIKKDASQIFKIGEVLSDRCENMLH